MIAKRPLATEMTNHDQIAKRLAHRLFAGPLIQNNVRGDYVEEMIALALEPEWRLCSGDWGGWDLEDDEGCRIQVKQSAATQTWGGKPYAGGFDISPSTGYWVDGAEWIALPGRLSDIYIFAWHPETGPGCNHTDPNQWRFFVVPEQELPGDQRSVRPSVLARGRDSISHAQLAEKLTSVRREISNERLKLFQVPAK